MTNKANLSRHRDFPTAMEITATLKGHTTEGKKKSPPSGQLLPFYKKQMNLTLICDHKLLRALRKQKLKKTIHLCHLNQNSKPQFRIHENNVSEVTPGFSQMNKTSLSVPANVANTANYELMLHVRFDRNGAMHYKQTVYHYGCLTKNHKEQGVNTDIK